MLHSTKHLHSNASPPTAFSKLKTLIALNFAIGALLMVGRIAFQKYEGVGLLAGVFLLPGFFALALVNTAAIMRIRMRF